MADLTKQLLADLKGQRIKGLASNLSFQYPAYNGQSILNIPNSICSLLGVREFGAPALRLEILGAMKGPYKRVIFLLVDALAYHRLQSWIGEPEFAIWKRLAQGGLLAPLTSVTPSTTCAALTSLWTGKSPAQHGVVGYELWLKEFGMVANMITHAPFSFERQIGTLQHAGFVPQDFLGLPTLGTHLSAHGLKPYAFQNYSILGSGLSNMFFPDVTRIGFHSSSDLWISLRQLIENRPDERAYYWAYWPDVDTYSHKFGPNDERVRAEFSLFTLAFEQLFWNNFPADLRDDTLFLMAADHGQVHTENDPHYDLRNHPNLIRRLHMQPTGENRLVFLYVRPGQIEAVKEYIERTWPNQFVIMESGYALDNGLFGPGQSNPRLSERIGDLVVIARGSAYWWWSPTKENPLIGRHGGLLPEEMLVPLLAAPLTA
jgi:hypothetical protein